MLRDVIEQQDRLGSSMCKNIRSRYTHNRLLNLLQVNLSLSPHGKTINKDIYTPFRSTTTKFLRTVSICYWLFIDFCAAPKLANGCNSAVPSVAITHLILTFRAISSWQLHATLCRTAHGRRTVSVAVCRRATAVPSGSGSFSIGEHAISS